MAEEQKREKKPNEIFIGRGKKDEKTGEYKDNFDRYINIINKVHNQGHAEIILKARGGQIAKAINLALHKDFENILEIDMAKTKIYAEEFDKKGEREGDDGKMITVRASNIDLVLKKKK